MGSVCETEREKSEKVEKEMSIINNSPISNEDKNIEKKDLFNFKHYAKKVQKIIQNNSNNSSPLTIGVYGKWGEGKTSFLNLVEKQIDSWKKEGEQKGILKYHFNPWRYSTEDEMLFDFFEGLSKQMYLGQERTLKKIGKKLIKYSRYAKAIKLSATVGLSSSNKLGTTFNVDEIMKALGEDFIGKEVTLNNLIEEINEKLEKSNYKVVVFIDDIDRLDKDEIYTILKLIKLNANFKNFVYLVALDEEYVAKAISKRYGDNIEDGKLFLEKVINIPIHLPKVEEEDFRNFFQLKLKEVANNLNVTDRKGEIEEIEREFQNHFFKNGREIIRILNSFFISAFAIGEDVNLSDLFWIEFLKVKYNKVFDYLKKYDLHQKELINVVDLFGHHDALKSYYDVLEQDSRKIIDLLFPDDNNILQDEIRRKELRINHQDNFEKYFSYHTERKISSYRKYELQQNIKDKDSDKLKENIVRLREDKNIRINLFEDLIKKELLFIDDENNNREFFYEFMFSNLDLFSEGRLKRFGLGEYKLSLIRIVSDVISRNKMEISLSTGKLIIEELFVFIEYLNQDLELKFKAQKELLKKVQKYIEDKEISFIDYDLKNERKILLMFIWGKYDNNDFLNYLDEVFKNSHTANNFIKIFTNYDGVEREQLIRSGYEGISGVIETGFIYEKINKYSKSIIEKVDPNESINDFYTNNVGGFLEQFVYWHKKYLARETRS